MAGFTPKNWIDEANHAGPPAVPPGTPLSAVAMEDAETRLSDYSSLLAGTVGNIYNVMDYAGTALVNNGTVNAYTTIREAGTALVNAGAGCLYFPPGTYRVTTAGRLLHFGTVSDIGIKFASGAELLVDNLSGGVLTNDLIHFEGPGTAIYVDGFRSRLAAGTATTRNSADVLQFVNGGGVEGGSGDAPTNSNTLANIHIRDADIQGASGCGMLFYGCSDVYISNVRVTNALSSGVFYDRCRRTHTNNLRVVNSGDDGLAYQTYGAYGGTLTEWHNSESVANNIVIKEDTETSIGAGVAINGAWKLALSNVVAVGKEYGIRTQASDTGTGELASREVVVSNVVCKDQRGYGIYIQSLTLTFADSDVYVRRNMSFENIVVADCVGAHGFYMGDSAVKGVSVRGVRCYNTDFYATWLRDCEFSDIYVEGSSDNLTLIGSETTGDPNAYVRNNIDIGKLTNKGGMVYLLNLRGVTVGEIRAMSSVGTGITIERCCDVHIGMDNVSLPNRGDAANTRGIYQLNSDKVLIDSTYIEHDNTQLEYGVVWASSYGQGFWAPRVVYRDQINSAASPFYLGGTALVALFNGEWYRGGSAAPVWTQESEDWYP